MRETETQRNSSQEIGKAESGQNEQRTSGGPRSPLLALSRRKQKTWRERQPRQRDVEGDQKQLHGTSDLQGWEKLTPNDLHVLGKEKKRGEKKDDGRGATGRKEKLKSRKRGPKTA